MSNDLAIRVEGLGKCYRIGERRAAYRTLRETIAGMGKARGKLLGRRVHRQETIWALKDIDLEVRRGEVLGVIGRNGAGKTTLLKILSRITEPTTGRVELHGRVGSLLEVGTGFHPELTGRENIYLNGAILGMRKAEIERKFDEIVAFAEIEKFLDTPVKHYSSGMYVRLAFAVAAHLDPEILLVDEVLAVGDAAFQKKCLGKMDDVARRGRTVLFVSHNMAAIEVLTTHSALLREGRVTSLGPTLDVIRSYLEGVAGFSGSRLTPSAPRTGTGEVRLTSFHIEDGSGSTIGSAASGRPLVLVLGYTANEADPPRQVSFGLSIHNARGDTVSVLYSDYMGISFESVPRDGRVTLRIDDLPLSNGRYLVGARVLAHGRECDWPRDFIGSFEVVAGDFYGTGRAFHSGVGPVLLRGSWAVEDSQVAS